MMPYPKVQPDLLEPKAIPVKRAIPETRAIPEIRESKVFRGNGDLVAIRGQRLKGGKKAIPEIRGQRVLMAW